MTVVTRAKIVISSVTGTFSVGDTVTASGSGNGTGTVTLVQPTYLYLSNATGTIDGGQVETVTNGSGASATVDSYQSTVNRFLVNGVEGQSITMIDDNTYRLDTSDASNASHPIALGTSVTGLLGRQYSCLLYTSPSPRDLSTSRMPSSA